MKIEIKKGSVEERLVKRAVELFNYTSATEFVRAAIFAYYGQRVELLQEEVGAYTSENTLDNGEITQAEIRSGYES